MRIKGKLIDPLQLWSVYCDVKPGPGPFLDLCFCPNPSHPNSVTPAFQINIYKPLTHCYSNCGISGTYAHSIAVIEGLYDEFNVSDEEIQLAKTPWELHEPVEIRSARVKVRRVHNATTKIIFKHAGLIAGTTKAKKAVKTSPIIVAKPKEKPLLAEEDLGSYTYLPKEAIEYLESRGIDESSRHRWQIGFDEEVDRVTIPVRDHRGRLLFIIRRGIHKWQHPAYLYPPEAPKQSILFGACNLDLALVRSMGLIVVEGSIDTICLHQMGWKNTVGSLGNHLSNEQLKLITKFRPARVYAFGDKDEGGFRLMLSAEPLKKKYPVLVPLYPKGNNLDPAKLSPMQVEKALGKAVPLDRLKRKAITLRRKGAVGNAVA